MKYPCLAVIGSLSIGLLFCATTMPIDPVHAAARNAADAETQISDSKLKPLSAAEVAERRTLNHYIKSLEGKSGRAIIYQVKGPVSEISSDPLAKLFPKWKFYVVPYHMRKHPDFKGPVAIADGPYNVYGVNGHGEGTEFFGYGNHEEIGRFLASNKVRLRNTEEGRHLWTAICHLVRQGGPNSEPRREEPNLWHLGVELSGDKEYYYEVRTAEDGTILSGKLQAKPPWPGKKEKAPAAPDGKARDKQTEATLPLPGGNQRLSELAMDCKGALMATLLEVGKPEIGPPGAADYASTWCVKRVLRGAYPSVAKMRFRVQSYPMVSAERPPVVRKTYLLISYDVNANQIAAILEADGENLRRIEGLLRR